MITVERKAAEGTRVRTLFLSFAIDGHLTFTGLVLLTPCYANIFDSILILILSQ
jgi:hypothetical protein